VSQAPPSESLQVLHDLLMSHFQGLRQERDLRGGGKPIFALEHGLTLAEIADLQVLVRASLKDGAPSPKWWLPIVIYAAEVGYRYSGDEYWQTFEAETPGWTEHGDRNYVRDKFLEFANRFGGARPSGVWAKQFSIICWPITHAVLPTDLQEYLARLLFDYRHLLTKELQEDPDALGRKLASRAFGTSSRFINFAQSPDLLGQVAGALLRGKDETSPLLLSTTLARIAADLGRKRHARRWLEEAKSSAHRINLKGLMRIAGRTGYRRGTVRVRISDLMTPQLSLSRNESGTWDVAIDLPQLPELRATFPELHDALRRLRCIVAGGPPLASGRVLYSPRLTLAAWPSARIPLLQLQNAPDPKYNETLADECHLSAGPPWLFKITDAESAIEVTGKTVRPGGNYVLLGEPNPSVLTVDWIRPQSLGCSGIRAYAIKVPAPIGADEFGKLRSLGLDVVSDIEIRPVGLIPAAWDGEGRAEWIGGDFPLLAVSSNRDITRCTIGLDGDAAVQIPWPTSQPHRVYLQVTDLDPGEHELRVTLEPTNAEAEPVDGKLSILVREPRAQSLTGMYREALVILASPASPTLDELWEGKASVEVVGPIGLPISLKVNFEHGSGAAPLRTQSQMSLPIDSHGFAEAFDVLARGEEISEQYDEATACLIEVSHPDLGSASLRCEREFAPLRWGVGRDREGPYLRLHDNLGNRHISVERFSFSNPDIRQPVTVGLDSRWRSVDGGLFVAVSQEFNAGVVLPPTVRDLRDLRRATVRPWISHGSRSSDTVLAWMELSRLWTAARLPGNAFARYARNEVLRSFSISICSVICGPRWSAGERLLQAQGKTALVELGKALNETAYQGLVASDVKRRAPGFVQLSLDERVGEFARYVRKIAPVVRPAISPESLSGFLLRLASSPGQTTRWGGPLARVGIDVAIQQPMMLRVARYLVLVVHSILDKSTDASPYESWAWE